VVSAHTAWVNINHSDSFPQFVGNGKAIPVTTLKVKGYISDEVTEFFNLPNTSSRTIAWGRLSLEQYLDSSWG
jgi:hypothetical protein